MSLPNIIKTCKVANYISVKSFRLPLESLDSLDSLESSHLQSFQIYQNFQSPRGVFSLEKIVSPIGEGAVLPMERRRSRDDSRMLAAEVHVELDAPAGLAVQLKEAVFDDKWLRDNVVPPII